MKIILTTSGDNLSAPLDPRFGRAPRFILYDLESDVFEVVENGQNMNAAQGAGIQSAETVVKLGAKAIITGNCGPNAFRALQSAGVRIYNSTAQTVAVAIEEYRSGKLTEANTANASGHW